jgi:hypothetical protein
MRTPVCAFVRGTSRVIVVCADGTIWQYRMNDDEWTFLSRVPQMDDPLGHRPDAQTPSKVHS